MSTAVEEAYARCEAITRDQAANFYYGIRLLSGERRRAMCAVYAFARRVDDIGDGTLATERKAELLDEEDRALALLAGAGAQAAADPVMVALADARTRFPLPVDALGELVEGVRMDVVGTKYETFDDLVPYCRRVAGTIGRLCLAIFGLRDPSQTVRAQRLADELGVALQLTNILRDVREDAEGGRIYLPGDELAAHSLPARDPAALAAAVAAAAGPQALGREDFVALVRFEAARARDWFDRGMELAPLLDRRSAACLLAMAGIYRRLLERIDADPAAILAGRVSLPAREKALVAVRGLIGVPGVSRVVVVGGGLAGITAALDCAEAGAAVTLVEVRRRLGGAAYSFERDGLQMDNGQHVFLRCCTAYRGLLDRLGSTGLVALQEQLEIPVLAPGRRPYVLRSGRLRAPGHLAGALALYPRMSPLARIGAARAALALGRLDPEDPAVDRIAFGEWLAQHGQNRKAVAALWDLVALPTLNLPAADASLAMSAFVFQTGLLASAHAGDIGFHAGTLQEIIGDPAGRALAAAGVEVRLGWRAERLERVGEGYRLDGRAASGPDSVDAQAAIVALPHDRAGGLLEPLLGPHAGMAAALESSPIVNLHVVYTERVLDQPFAAGVGTPVQYLFDRTAAAGAPAGHQYLAISLSGASAEMQESVPELRARYLAAMAKLLPRARAATVERFQVTREHSATFRAAPGSGALRPGPRTKLPGLVLAGAWTDTGWPATLEGAVLSGGRAAKVALGELDRARAAAAAPANGDGALGVEGEPYRPPLPEPGT